MNSFETYNFTQIYKTLIYSHSSGKEFVSHLPDCSPTKLAAKAIWLAPGHSFEEATRYFSPQLHRTYHRIPTYMPHEKKFIFHGTYVSRDSSRYY